MFNSCGIAALFLVIITGIVGGFLFIFGIRQEVATVAPPINAEITQTMYAQALTDVANATAGTPFPTQEFQPVPFAVTPGAPAGQLPFAAPPVAGQGTPLPTLDPIFQTATGVVENATMTSVAATQAAQPPTAAIDPAFQTATAISDFNNVLQAATATAIAETQAARPLDPVFQTATAIIDNVTMTVVVATQGTPFPTIGNTQGTGGAPPILPYVTITPTPNLNDLYATATAITGQIQTLEADRSP